jgi:hypothetical protein
MIKLYLIAGFIVATIIAVVGFWIAAKKEGREEERYENIEDGLKDAKKTAQRDAKRRNNSNDVVNKRLRKYIID